jgi:hypothetical protein
MNNKMLLTICVLVPLALPAFGASDKCLAVNGIANKKISTTVQASFAGVTDSSTGNRTFTYTFSGSDGSSTDGVPGLINYCVYPDGANLPTAGTAANPTGALGTLAAVGANGEPFVASGLAKGSFAFTRAHGDPSNIAFDGNTYTMGTATWSGKCTTDYTDPLNPVTVCSPTSTETQTILLHINDPAECANLYGAGSSNTCWVFPAINCPSDVCAPPPPCNGNPACKSAVIDEASGAFDANGYPIVPMNTLLHIHYTYVIVNQATNTYDMIFNAPGPKTQDINSGGGKDYFGCEQVADGSGAPGSWGNTISNYQNTGFTFTSTNSTGQCGQSRFTIVSPKPGPITLHPGQSISFTVDMITGLNKAKKQEFTSAGPHLLNSGFTIKWFQNNDTILHSFTTGITPLYVNAQP